MGRNSDCGRDCPEPYYEEDEDFPFPVSEEDDGKIFCD